MPYRIIPPGTAPAPVPVDKDLPMWTAPIKTLQGQDTTLASYKGKALLLVNVASKCGLTPQYEGLEILHKTYADRGFSVVGSHTYTTKTTYRIKITVTDVGGQSTTILSTAVVGGSEMGSHRSIVVDGEYHDCLFMARVR